MDDKTQVNINRTDRNKIPPWAWGAIAAAALALILGYLLFFNQPQPQTAVTPTVTPTSLVVEVTSTPNLLTPSATPLTVEVTPTAGSPTAAGPTTTAVIVEVTSTPGPPSATPVVVATVTVAATAAVQATAATTAGASPSPSGALPSPQATLTADEQTVMDALRGGTNGDRVTTVRFDGTDLTLGFQLVEGATAATAREQVRAILVALSQNTLAYTKLMLRGGTAIGSQESPAIQLIYDRSNVTNLDWSTLPDADVYGRAESRTLQPPFDTP
ncbi:MAG: hypothetical protein ABIO92_06050 [Chloroflexia bacterium]